MRIGGGIEKPYSSPEEWYKLIEELGYRAVLAPIDHRSGKEERQAYLQCTREHDRQFEPGIPYMQAAPSWQHQSIADEIFRQISTFLFDKSGRVFMLPLMYACEKPPSKVKLAAGGES